VDGNLASECGGIEIDFNSFIQSFSFNIIAINLQILIWQKCRRCLGDLFWITGYVQLNNKCIIVGVKVWCLAIK
jgi:hypothetical protein